MLIRSICISIIVITISMLFVSLRNVSRGPCFYEVWQCGKFIEKHVDKYTATCESYSDNGVYYKAIGRVENTSH